VLLYCQRTRVKGMNYMEKRKWRKYVIRGIIICILICGFRWCCGFYSQFMAPKPWDYPYTKWECEEIGLCYMNENGYEEDRAIIQINGEWYQVNFHAAHNSLIDIDLKDYMFDKILGGDAWFSSRKCKVKVTYDTFNLVGIGNYFTLKRTDITKEEYEAFKEKVDNYPVVTRSELEKKLGIAE